MLWFVDSPDIQISTTFSDESIPITTKSETPPYMTLRDPTSSEAADLVFTIEKEIRRRTSWFSRSKVITKSSIHTVHVKKSVCETIVSIRNLLKKSVISNKRRQNESLNDFVVEAGYALRYVWDRFVYFFYSSHTSRVVYSSHTSRVSFQLQMNKYFFLHVYQAQSRCKE